LPDDAPLASFRFLAVAIAVFSCVIFSGCASFHLPPRHTSMESARTVLAAALVSNFLVIETPVDKHSSYHFIVDTGSSVTQVTPDVVKRFGGKSSPNQLPMRVRGANGEVKLLDPVILKRLQLGAARFEGVPALTHDLEDLSNHLGIRVDCVLGFPLFRQTLLTLDYLESQIVITPFGVPTARPGVTVPFNNEQNTPLIPIQLGRSQGASMPMVCPRRWGRLISRGRGVQDVRPRPRLRPCPPFVGRQGGRLRLGTRPSARRPLGACYFPRAAWWRVRISVSSSRGSAGAK
jgi:hypothetical protein